MPPKSPKSSKMTLFALELFICPLDFSETLPKYGDNCYERISITAHPGKTLVRVPRGTFRAKTPHFGFFQTFVQNVIMYVFIVVFYGTEFKFTGPNT